MLASARPEAGEVEVLAVVARKLVRPWDTTSLAARDAVSSG